MKIGEEREKQSINITLICDENYIIPTTITVLSIIKNRSRQHQYNIYIIITFTELEKIQILESLSDEGVCINIIQRSSIKLEEIDQGTDGRYMVASKAALVKFFLPEILPECNKVLYLDGDIIIQTDLVELFNTNIEKYYAAVVRDLPQVLYKYQLIGKEIAGTQYFNSGVMLLNLKALRKDNIVQQLVKTQKERRDRILRDQNTFNIVFKDQVTFLDASYNVCVLSLLRSKDKYSVERFNYVCNTNYSDYKAIISNAKIIHFSSREKPWYFFDVPYSDLWYRYYLESPYKEKQLIRISRAEKSKIDSNYIDGKIKRIAARVNQEKVSIPIVFAANNTYALYAGAVIQSIIDHASPDYYYDITILNDETLMLSTKERLVKMSNENVSVTCVDVRNFVDTNLLYCHAHFTRQMYYRFLIPEIFTQYSKVIYLDCDLMVLSDIAELFNKNIEGVLFAGIRNVMHQEMSRYIKDSLQLNPEEYINSGVLLINCKEFFLQDVKGKAFELLEKERALRFPDQDLLNIIGKGKIGYLEDEWNFQWHHQFARTEDKRAIDIEHYNWVKDHAKIIHYTSGLKPWKRPDKRYANIFWEYARKTEFYEEIIYVNNRMVIQERGMRILQLEEELRQYKLKLEKLEVRKPKKIRAVLTFIPNKIKELFMRRKRKKFGEE